MMSDKLWSPFQKSGPAKKEIEIQNKLGKVGVQVY